jgi:hypothetical protein
MRPTTLVCLIIALACGATAQDLPKVELFGGYSFLHLDVPDEIAGPSTVIPNVNLHGWRAGVTTNFGNHFGLVVEGSGHYGTASFSGIPVDATAYSVLAGPRLATRYRRLTFFATGLVGPAYARAEEFGESASTVALAAAMGGGVDLHLNRHFAVRTHPEYFLTRFLDERQDNFRFSTGLVFKFGE